MNSSAEARNEIIDRLDGLAVLCEQLASDAAGDGAIELATDLWVTSARLLAAADELWHPVRSGDVFLETPAPTDSASSDSTSAPSTGSDKSTSDGAS